MDKVQSAGIGIFSTGILLVIAYLFYKFFLKATEIPEIIKIALLLIFLGLIISLASLESPDMKDMKEIGSVNDLIGISICFLGQKWKIKFRELEMRKYLVEYHKLFLWYETPISVHKKYFLALVKAKQNGKKIIPAILRKNET